jgi:hypothetical protein
MLSGLDVTCNAMSGTCLLSHQSLNARVQSLCDVRGPSSMMQFSVAVGAHRYRIPNLVGTPRCQTPNVMNLEIWEPILFRERSGIHAALTSSAGFTQHIGDDCRVAHKLLS